DTRLTAAEACTLYQRKNIDKTLWASRMLSEGYSLVEGIHAYGSSLPYPSIGDIMLYSRYADEGRISRETVWKYFDVPADEFELWHWLTLQRLTTMQVQTLYRRGHISSTQLFTELSKIGWSPDDRPFIEQLGWTMPNAMLLMQGDLFQEMPDAEILR
ncbi:unnamed protein product, partial [marine sediment metagenome]